MTTPTPQEIKDRQLEILAAAKAALQRAKDNLCKIEDRINDSSKPALSNAAWQVDYHSADGVPAHAVILVSNQNTEYEFELA